MRAEVRKGYRRARGASDVDAPLDYHEVEDAIADAEAEVVEDRSLGRRLTMIGLLAALLLDPLNLRDRDVIRYLRRKVNDVAGQFHALRMAGERAAFRVGGRPSALPAPEMLDVIAPARVEDWTGPPPPVQDPSAVGGAVLAWWVLGA